MASVTFLPPDCVIATRSDGNGMEYRASSKTESPSSDFQKTRVSPVEFASFFFYEPKKSGWGDSSACSPRSRISWLLQHRAKPIFKTARSKCVCGFGLSQPSCTHGGFPKVGLRVMDTKKNQKILNFEIKINILIE